MSTDYLPSRESELKEFASNFAARIVAAPNTYGLVAGDATVIDEAAQEFATKYDLAVAPPTRTTSSIIEKNNAKDALVAIVRGYAMLIKANRAVEDSAKVNLGLRLADLTPTPIPAPQTQPIINIVGMTARRHILRFADILTPESRTRPAGVYGLQLLCQVADGASAPADPLAARFRGVITRHQASIDFDIADGGKTAYYFARWQSFKGLVGPWSDMLRVGIAG